MTSLILPPSLPGLTGVAVYMGAELAPGIASLHRVLIQGLADSRKNFVARYHDITKG
jgi:hypothetical protein